MLNTFSLLLETCYLPLFLYPRPRNRAPGRAPAGLDQNQAHQTDDGKRGELQETGGKAAGQIAREPERACQEETAQAAGRADETGHDADLVTKAQRYELEHASISHSHRHR